MRTALTGLTGTGAVIVIALATATGPALGAAPSPEPALEPIWETVDLPYSNLAVAPDGHLWASTPDSTFDIYDREGTLVETWGTFGRGEGQFDFETPCGSRGGVAFRPDGGFYVSDSDNARIQEFDADRVFVRSWGSYGTGEGQFTGPDSIALDAAGNIYVNDTCGENDGSIHVFDPQGAELRLVNEPNQGPFFALDPDGTIYVIDETAMDLLAVRPDGTTETLADLTGAASFGTGLLHLPDGGFLVASELIAEPGGPENLVHVGADGQVRHVWPNGGWYMALDAAGDRFYVTSDQLRAYALPAATSTAT